MGWLAKSLPTEAHTPALTRVVPDSVNIEPSLVDPKLSIVAPLSLFVVAKVQSISVPEPKA